MLTVILRYKLIGRPRIMHSFLDLLCDERSDEVVRFLVYHDLFVVGQPEREARQRVSRESVITVDKCKDEGERTQLLPELFPLLRCVIPDGSSACAVHKAHASLLNLDQHLRVPFPETLHFLVGDLAISQRFRPIRRPLKYWLVLAAQERQLQARHTSQLGCSLCNHRNSLDCRRASANNSHSLAGKIHSFFWPS